MAGAIGARSARAEANISRSSAGMRTRASSRVAGRVVSSERFKGHLGSMLRLDFYRLFHTPLLAIMCAVSALVPAMVLTMVSANERVQTQTFDNTWQVVELVHGGNAGMTTMDMALLCNINMVFIFTAIMVSIFVSHDYSSGFIKSIFTTHARKLDYAVSKSVVGAFSGACMVLCYVAGAVVAGVIASKSFALPDAGVMGVVACVLSKMCLMALFSPLYVAVAVFFKQRLWVTILGSFFVGVMFYPVAMLTSPLDSSLVNLLLCAAGGALFGAVFCAAGNLFLRTRDLA